MVLIQFFAWVYDLLHQFSSWSLIPALAILSGVYCLYSTSPIWQNLGIPNMGVQEEDVGEQFESHSTLLWLD